MSIWATVGGFDVDGDDSDVLYVGVATSGMDDRVRLSVGLGQESALLDAAQVRDLIGLLSRTLDRGEPRGQ